MELLQQLDGVIAAVGSANLTSRSMRRSKEVTMFVHGVPDAFFIKRLRDQLEADISKSEQRDAPFELGFIDHVMALAGKYTW